MPKKPSLATQQWKPYSSVYYKWDSDYNETVCMECSIYVCVRFLFGWLVGGFTVDVMVEDKCVFVFIRAQQLVLSDNYSRIVLERFFSTLNWCDGRVWMFWHVRLSVHSILKGEHYLYDLNVMAKICILAKILEYFN